MDKVYHKTPMWARYDYHCIHCGAPPEMYKPFETYDGRCCELFGDISDLVFDYEAISFSRLLKICAHLRAKYPDIPDFKATMKEIFDILEELGAINHKPKRRKDIYILYKITMEIFATGMASFPYHHRENRKRHILQKYIQDLKGEDTGFC